MHCQVTIWPSVETKTNELILLINFNENEVFFNKFWTQIPLQKIGI
jgi:hypothetical protein